MSTVNAPVNLNSLSIHLPLTYKTDHNAPSPVSFLFSQSSFILNPSSQLLGNFHLCLPSQLLVHRHHPKNKMARKKPSKAQMAYYAVAAHLKPEPSKEQPSNSETKPVTASAVARVSITNSWISFRMVVTRKPLPASRSSTTSDKSDMWYSRQMKRHEEAYRESLRIKQVRKNLPKIMVTTPDGSKWEPDDMPQWRLLHRSNESQLMMSQWERRENLSPLRIISTRKRRSRRRAKLPEPQVTQGHVSDRPPGCRLWA